MAKHVATSARAWFGGLSTRTRLAAILGSYLLLAVILIQVLGLEPGSLVGYTGIGDIQAG